MAGSPDEADTAAGQSAGSGPIARAAYDQLAASYSALAPTKPHNALYDRPAVMELLGPVAGETVLDAGCGPGIYAELLLRGGAARVVSCDVSEQMITHANQRVAAAGLAHRFSAHVHDLATPLGFLADAEVDAVVAPLCLDYLPDWGPVFLEFRRVLRPGGRLVFSCEHPASTWRMGEIQQSYFAVELTTCTWRGFGLPVDVPSYRRPLSAMLNPLAAAGFVLERFHEPVASAAFLAAAGPSGEQLATRPGFLAVRAVLRPGP